MSTQLRDEMRRAQTRERVRRHRARRHASVTDADSVTAAGSVTHAGSVTPARVTASRSVTPAGSAEDREVGWRVEAMRRQLATTAALPFLVARPGAFPVGACMSCGDRLLESPAIGSGRCPPCREAASLIAHRGRTTTNAAGRTSDNGDSPSCIAGVER